MLKKLTLAAAALLFAGAAIAAEKEPKRPADLDYTPTQTIPAEQAGAPDRCEVSKSAAQSGACTKPAEAANSSKSPYPVNALEGLNLGL